MAAAGYRGFLAIEYEEEEWEDEEGDKLPKFVGRMGKKMDYNVGYSGNQDGMAASWMEAAAQNGIPTAFIVKDRKIMWTRRQFLTRSGLVALGTAGTCFALPGDGRDPDDGRQAVPDGSAARGMALPKSRPIGSCRRFPASKVYADRT